MGGPVFGSVEPSYLNPERLRKGIHTHTPSMCHFSLKKDTEIKTTLGRTGVQGPSTL